ncbi:MAG: DUF1461 domain-containing protein [Clostridia bacterium]|nr:DUF1461 domain-containing protein [Clostridia bacterium]
MRNTIGKLCVILATLLLLFAAGFHSTALVLKDSDYIEEQYQKQNVSELMGMSVPDLSAATEVLLSYMRGERENIHFAARVNGAELENIFYHEKEVVHMAEVQSLWLGLDAFSWYAVMAAAALLVTGIALPERGKRRPIFGSGVIWGAGIFGGVLVFFGAWAIMNFQSFWTVFHFVLFPGSLFQYLAAGATPEALNELNWVLSSDSIMVNMLMPIFPGLVLRCAIFVIAEIAFVLLIGLMVRFIGRKKVTEAVADIVTVEHDANEPVAIDGPDLVLAHQIRNAPVSKREELRRRAKKGLPLFDEPQKPEAPEEPTIELRDDTEEAGTTPQSPDGDSSPCTGEPEETSEQPEEPSEEPEEPTIELRDDTEETTPQSAEADSNPCAGEPEETREQPEEPSEEPEEPTIELRDDTEETTTQSAEADSNPCAGEPEGINEQPEETERKERDE